MTLSLSSNMIVTLRAGPSTERQRSAGLEPHVAVPGQPESSGCFALRVAGLVLAARLPPVRPVLDHGDRCECDRYDDNQRNDCAPVTGRSNATANAHRAPCKGNHVSVTS
jgi:hypothetical protein